LSDLPVDGITSLFEAPATYTIFDVRAVAVAAEGTMLVLVISPLAPPGVSFTSREPQTGQVSDEHGTPIGCVTVTSHMGQTHNVDRPLWAAPEPA
jgi:hypothetical protein